MNKHEGASTITFSYIFIAGVFDALTNRSTKYALSLPPGQKAHKTENNAHE